MISREIKKESSSLKNKKKSIADPMSTNLISSPAAKENLT
jgi:hypothetical protein